MKFTRSVLLVALVVVVSTLAAVAHLTDTLPAAPVPWLRG
jgi:hypothetical protein